MTTYGISFDVNMMINTTETNFKEASEFINLRLFLYIIFIGIIPSFIMFKYINIKDEKFLKHKLTGGLTS